MLLWKYRSITICALVTLFLQAVFAACFATASDSLNSYLYRTSINDFRQFQEMSKPGQGLINQGLSVKFFVDARDSSHQNPFFINSNFQVNGTTPDEAIYHVDFSQKILNHNLTNDEFNKITYFTAQKIYFAGMLHIYTIGPHQQPILAVQFYPQDVIREDSIVQALRILKTRLNLKGFRLVFLATGSQQTTQTVRQQLANLGFQNYSMNALINQLSYLPHQKGEAWGTLKFFPKGITTKVGPHDIVVSSEFSRDIPQVAGVLQTGVRNGTYFNFLDLRIRRIPTASVFSNPDFKRLNEHPVHLVLEQDGYRLNEISQEELKNQLESSPNKPTNTPEVESVKTPFASSSVIILTQVLDSHDVYGYTVFSQLGSVMGVAVMAFIRKETATLTLIQKPGLRLALEKKREIVKLVRDAEILYCEQNKNYYLLKDSKRKCSEVTDDDEKEKVLMVSLEYSKENNQWIIISMQEIDRL